MLVEPLTENNLTETELSELIADKPDSVYTPDMASGLLETLHANHSLVVREPEGRLVGVLCLADIEGTFFMSYGVWLNRADSNNSMRWVIRDNLDMDRAIKGILQKVGKTIVIRPEVGFDFTRKNVNRLYKIRPFQDQGWDDFNTAHHGFPIPYIAMDYSDV